MEKIKKIALSLFALVAFIFCVNLNVNASSTTANAKGISTTGLSYINDYNTGYQEINGSKYYYGKIKLWSSVYNYYHEDNDTMYYVVFVQSFINGYGYDKKIGYFYSKSMNVNVTAYATGVNEVAYRPVQGTSDVTVSYQASLTSQVGTDSSLSIGYSYGQSINTTDIDLQIDSNDNYNTANVEFDYNFVYYSSRSTSKRSPYRGEYYRISSVVFEVNNYSSTTNNAVVFDVEYTGSIYRDNLKNSTDYEMAKKITHKYCIGTSVNTCYDTVGEEYDV